ncbi:MAG: deoxyribodipyrimidine photo-lyase [Casimicrobiaceae bacterium]
MKADGALALPVGRALVWFRRDLRDTDHAALAHALAMAREVYCVFVFDREILDALPSPRDRRVAFIHASVAELDAALARRGGGLVVLHDRARDAIPALAVELAVQAVVASRDYEPGAKARDAAVARALESGDIAWITVKDQVIFDGDEVLTRQGKPFTVFTPYKNAWRRALDPAALASRDPPRAAGTLARPARKASLPSLCDLGFESVDLDGAEPGMQGASHTAARFVDALDDYATDRDLPAREGTSRLSVHLRFGTVSVRALAAMAHQRALASAAPGAQKWLDELVWRDFYAQFLDHFPRVVREPYKTEYSAIRWRNDKRGFDAWCKGRTGYPLVDAGMRQLTNTGWMHNRLRMITASFLTKDLLIDWRRGERFFARHLIDYDLASNNGGWQWAASVGCDAQPWFRIFNPVTQSERFDPDGTYIRRYVPELVHVPAPDIHAPWQLSEEAQRTFGVTIGKDYPAPIVAHDGARQRALDAFDAARRGARAS